MSEWLAAGKTYAGIIVATQDDPRLNIRALLRLVDALSAEETVGQLAYLNNWV